MKTMHKIRLFHEGMTDAEQKDLAYWQRNVLALFFAEGWYNDDVEAEPVEHQVETHNPGRVETVEEVKKKPHYDGWRRVLSLMGGKICFHIPDGFDVGLLPEIAPNWDGHTTETKWIRMLDACGCAGQVPDPKLAAAWARQVTQPTEILPPEFEPKPETVSPAELVVTEVDHEAKTIHVGEAPPSTLAAVEALKAKAEPKAKGGKR